MTESSESTLGLERRVSARMRGKIRKGPGNEQEMDKLGKYFSGNVQRWSINSVVVGSSGGKGSTDAARTWEDPEKQRKGGRNAQRVKRGRATE